VEHLSSRPLPRSDKNARDEFYLAVITAATVIFVGVEQGIIPVIVLSLLLHVRHSCRPNRPNERKEMENDFIDLLF
jgi:MFS superfamily sulfate permease-like transporter